MPPPEENWANKLSLRLIKNPLMRRVLKNSGYLFSATGISAGISLLQSILTGRLLGVKGFGLLGVIFMFTSVVNKFVSFRMSELVIKYVGHYSETGDQKRAAAVYKAAALGEMAASILAFALIWLLSPLAATYLAKDASLANLFVVYGLIVLANLIAESSTGILQSFDRYGRIATFNLVQSLVTLAILVVVFFASGDILQVLLAYLAGKAAGAFGLTITALNEATKRWGRGWWKVPLSLLRPQARELTHFAVSTNLSATLSLVNKDSELLWVSFFRGPVEAGFYKAALSITNLIQLPISPLPQATYPEIAREVSRKNWNNVRIILRQGSLLAGAFSLVATILLALFGKQVILLFYKDPGFLPAYPALLILMAGLLVANTFYWNRIALLALGLPGFPTKLNLVLAILKVIGVLLLVPKFGYLASAALFSGSYIIGTSLSAWKTRQVLAARQSASIEVELQPSDPSVYSDVAAQTGPNSLGDDKPS
jgi:O-antigen/teichoic acid export membrane protein